MLKNCLASLKNLLQCCNREGIEPRGTSPCCSYTQQLSATALLGVQHALSWQKGFVPLIPAGFNAYVSVVADKFFFLLGLEGRDVWAVLSGAEMSLLTRTGFGQEPVQAHCDEDRQHNTSC